VITRRSFIQTTLAAAVSWVALPKRGYWCECGLVYYERRPEGYYAASYFAGQRFTYELYRRHENLHRQMAKTVSTDDRNMLSFREHIIAIAKRGHKIEGFELQAEKNGYRFARVYVEGEKSPFTFWQPWKGLA